MKNLVNNKELIKILSDIKKTKCPFNQYEASTVVILRKIESAECRIADAKKSLELVQGIISGLKEALLEIKAEHENR